MCVGVIAHVRASECVCMCAHAIWCIMVFWCLNHFRVTLLQVWPITIVLKPGVPLPGCLVSADPITLPNADNRGHESADIP